MFSIKRRLEFENSLSTGDVAYQQATSPVDKTVSVALGLGLGLGLGLVLGLGLGLGVGLELRELCMQF